MGAIPNRHTLRAVREQRGLELADVANFTKISPDSLGDFEEGTRLPSRRQVEKLAKSYGVPAYSFFGSNTPNLPSPPTDYRKINLAPASVSAKGLRALLLAEKVSQFTKQLAIELKYRPSLLDLTASAESNSVKQARAARAAFDSWHQPREKSLGFTGRPEEVFIGALRLFLEIQGRIVHVNDAPPSDFMGFLLQPDAGYSIAFVNRSIQSKKAQLFTLAHEYAHILQRAPGISDPFVAKNKIERHCNIFAAEFIAPSVDFIRTIERASKADRLNTSAIVNFASRTSLLSKHAAAIRLVETGFVSQADFNSWRRIFRLTPKAEKDDEKLLVEPGPGGNPHAKRLSEIGYLPVLLAGAAVDKRFIDWHDVTECLGLSQALQERALKLVRRRFSAAAP